MVEERREKEVFNERYWMLEAKERLLHGHKTKVVYYRVVLCFVWCFGVCCKEFLLQVASFSSLFVFFGGCFMVHGISAASTPGLFRFFVPVYQPSLSLIGVHPIKNAACLFCLDLFGGPSNQNGLLFRRSLFDKTSALVFLLSTEKLMNETPKQNKAETQAQLW